MAKKIYVGNLNYNTTQDQLGEMFAQFGDVRDVAIIYDRFTNQSKGFGFVEMEEDDAATAAISPLSTKPKGGNPKSMPLTNTLSEAVVPPTSVRLITRVAARERNFFNITVALLFGVIACGCMRRARRRSRPDLQ